MTHSKPILFYIVVVAAVLLALPAHAQYTDTYAMPHDKMWGVFLDRQCTSYGDDRCTKWISIPDCIPLRNFPSRCRMVVNNPSPQFSSGQPSPSHATPSRPSPSYATRNQPSPSQPESVNWLVIGVLFIVFILGVLGRFGDSGTKRWEDPMPHIPRVYGKHRHHIIPRHMGGTDTPDNIAYLTPKQHAEAHLELYREYGKEEDLWAYRQLISNQEHRDSHNSISRYVTNKAKRRIFGRLGRWL